MHADEFSSLSNCQLDEQVWKGLEYLESVAGPGAIAEMVDHFNQDMPLRLQRMREQLGKDDMNNLARLAHDLKSNSATLGIPAISSLGARLEHAAEVGEKVLVDRLILEVELLLPQAVLQLERRRLEIQS
jgi:HPt (histidine-containing phosphotransfer) domain-containing protein